jgi:membrane protein required for colicin V production
MSFIDIILAALLIFGLVRGFMKGFFIEIASLVSLLAGLYGAIHFSYFIADWLKTKVEWNANYIQMAAFATTFLIILVGISLIGKLMTKIVKAASLGLLNKIAGAVFGATKIGLILSVLISMFAKVNNTISYVDKETLDKSILYNPVKDFAPTIYPSILEQVENLKHINIFPEKEETKEDNTNSQ